MPPYADGTHDPYEDFVGGVQFWGYGLVSGSGDGAVRMWDSKFLNAFLPLLRSDNVLQCVLVRLIEHC